MPVYAPKDDFGAIRDFPGVRKWSLGTTFSAKKLPFSSQRAPVFCDVLAGSFSGRFWVPLWSIRGGFGVPVGRFFMVFDGCSDTCIATNLQTAEAADHESKITVEICKNKAGTKNVDLKSPMDYW